MRRQAYPSEDLDSLPPPDSLTGPYLALLGAVAVATTSGIVVWRLIRLARPPVTKRLRTEPGVA